jgi:hypothetical protein
MLRCIVVFHGGNHTLLQRRGDKLKKGSDTFLVVKLGGGASHESGQSFQAL